MDKNLDYRYIKFHTNLLYSVASDGAIGKLKNKSLWTPEYKAYKLFLCTIEEQTVLHEEFIEVWLSASSSAVPREPRAIYQTKPRHPIALTVIPL